MEPKAETIAFFAKPNTTLAVIAAAGWTRYRSSSGEWWFIKQLPGELCELWENYLPAWVSEVIEEARRDAVSTVRGQIMHALGLQILGLGKAVLVRPDADRV